MAYNKVVNYVSTTPCNSNRAVLQSLLLGMSDNNGSLVSLTIGSTITGEPGSPAKVENVGTQTKPILQFTIPRGADGYTPEIGDNENWYINGVDTGKPSRGESGINDIVLASTTDIDNFFI